MIEKLDKHLASNINSCNMSQNIMVSHKAIEKINELVDAVNELQNRIDPPSVYQVMKDKDAIIGKHIGEKQRLQVELERTRKVLDVAVDALKLFDSGQYTPQPDAYGLKTDASRLARKSLDEIKTALEQKDK